MSSQRFCLRWNNHQSNLLSVFDQHLHDEAFVDVTLAVDGQFLRAHKMVLSACSPYFQALFVGHPDKHPIVILKDVPYSDMRSLLDFMYRGEVSVDQDRLTAFLKIAESLRIKGLTEVNEERCDLPSIANSLLNQSTGSSGLPSTLPPPNLHRIPIPAPKRPNTQSVYYPHPNAMLNSALSGPKRKRGRPRKLSGGSPGTPNTGMNDLSDHEDASGKQNHVDNNVTALRPEHMVIKSEGGTSPRSEGTSKEDRIANENSQNRSDSGTAQHSNDRTASQSPEMKIEKDEDMQDDDDSPDAEQENEDYVKNEEPKPGTSGQDVCLHSVSVSICEDVSITPAPVFVRSESPINDDVVITPIQDDVTINPVFEPGVHFLSHESIKEEPMDDEDDSSESLMPGRRDLLEYLINEDGSVVCKWCGELLPSRTHWYRHKYKFHISNPPGTSSLFKCYRCNVFFKSRKGYLGHVSTRHSRIEQKVIEKEELKPCKRGRRSSEDFQSNPEEYEKQREKEEKLVADIIDRVKRECEAQGSTVTRKGYSRRSTIMNT